MIHFYNEDCLPAMEQMEENQFDLAIVDPPYGINLANNPFRQTHKKADWDKSIPDKRYFDELFRVSKTQIIWGGNYMVQYLPPSSGWIYWDKMQNKSGHRYSKTLAAGELAFTSFDRPLEHFEYKYQGNYIGYPNKITIKTKQKTDLKIHPTQKPIELYRWLLTNYAEAGWTILDTHVGSGSSLIACEMEGFDATGYEIDEDYYNDACERIAKEREKLNQQKLF